MSMTQIYLTAYLEALFHQFQQQNITPFVKNVIKLGDQDKAWAPHRVLS